MCRQSGGLSWRRREPENRLLQISDDPLSQEAKSLFVCLLHWHRRSCWTVGFIFLFVYLRKFFHDHVPEHKFFIKRKVFKKSGGVAPLLKIN
jgi:hypothetical protein